jgi:hypothetical protein
MDIAIQLYGFLILTFLSIITPFIAILLSIFSDGVTELTEKYKNEQVRAEENLKASATADKTDLKAIENSIVKLKQTQKQAKSKLSYLNPKQQIIKVFSLLIGSFLTIVLYLVTKKLNAYLLLVISVLLFGYAIFIFWKLLNVIFEIRIILTRRKKYSTEQTIKLLSTIAEKSMQETSPFLTDVSILIDGIALKDDSMDISIENNKEQKLAIEFSNKERKMAKNIEIGLRIPFDFIIEKSSDYSIFSGEKDQIVRFHSDFVHGNTNLKSGHLIIKPMKEGEYKIRTFIKAENIESIYRYLTLIVTAKAETNQIERKER